MIDVKVGFPLTVPERHIIDRENFKLQRNAALVEWQQLCAAYIPIIHDTQRRVRIRLTAPVHGLWPCKI